MKKIILSALLASTVAVTAFAAPVANNLNGNDILGSASSLVLKTDSTVSFQLASADDLSFAGTLKQCDDAAEVTEVSEGVPAGFSVAEVQVPDKASIVCATPSSSKKGQINVVCGSNLKDVLKHFDNTRR